MLLEIFVAMGVALFVVAVLALVLDLLDPPQDHQRIPTRPSVPNVLGEEDQQEAPMT